MQLLRKKQTKTNKNKQKQTKTNKKQGSFTTFFPHLPDVKNLLKSTYRF